MDSISRGEGIVAIRGTRVTGYATGVGLFCHAVGENNEDICALVSSVQEIRGTGMLVPATNAELLGHFLTNGLTLVHTMNLMTLGLYSEPTGSYLPSVGY